MKKAGKNVKRSIKYNDNARDLVMDVKVDEEWVRISAAEARAVCKANPELRTGPKKMGRSEIAKFLSLSEGKSTGGEEEDIGEVVEVPADE